MNRHQISRKRWRDFIDGKCHLVPIYHELARKVWLCGFTR